MKEFWSGRIKDLTPYVPGEQPQGKRLIKLNTNENPYPPSPLALRAIEEAAGEGLRLYPDPEYRALREALAAEYGLRPEQIFAGNGSDEVLALCFQAFFTPGRPVCFPDITYSFYPVFCALFGQDYREIPLNEDFTVPVDRFLGQGGVVLPNPNAPTGLALPLGEIERLVAGNRDSVVVIDEAYVDFGGESAVSLIHKYPNLAVVGTASKSRSLAGLRVGWVMGDADLIAGVNCVKNSFNSYTLDRLAQAGAVAAIKDRAYFRETTAKIVATREATAPRLEALGFFVYPSRANFLFVRHPRAQAKALLDALRERDILVRWWSHPRISDCLRITVGTDEEMDRLIDALKELVGEG